MLKVGGGGGGVGGNLYNRALCAWKNFCDHAHFQLKPHPFGVIFVVRPMQWWQEFLGRNEQY